MNSAARTCSVVIPVYNHAGLTRHCVDALLAEPPRTVEREIIVVDDASSDSTADVLAGYDDRVSVVTHRENSGFAKTCNDGAAAASGEFLVFLNNDTAPREGWLDALIAFAEATPAAAVVGSKLLYANGTIQHAGIVITQERFPRHIYGGFPAEHAAVNKSRRYQCVTAAATLFRADVFHAAGGFDPAFMNAYEDVDLCLRLGRAGHEVHYCHESVVYHLETATRDFSKYQQNHELYLERWRDDIEPDDLGYYIEDGLLELTYWDQFPIQLTVSPLLALVRTPADDGSAAELATSRARQVFELLRENAHLKTLLLDGVVAADRATPAIIGPHGTADG